MTRGAGPAAFTELGCITAPTLAVLGGLGFTQATPVQEAVLPLFCGNKDVAVDACTGSGKTLAFIIPIVERLRRLEEPPLKHQVAAVVVAPTRELSRQIHAVAQPFLGSVSGITSLLLVGGTDPAEDVARFKACGGHVIVGTPGRIDDVMKRCPAMDLKRLEVLVLDEADRLLDMGFRAQLDAIMGRLPKQRRTGLFSATQTEAVAALARAGLRNPVRVNVAVTATQPATGRDAGAARVGSAAAAAPSEQKTPSRLHISYTHCEVDERLNQLVAFLRRHGSTQKVIVYCLTCACVDFMALALRRLSPKFLPGVQVCALHGRMKQSAREAVLASFTTLSAGVLLATDLAARGLDIPEVHWVVQVDPPQDPAAFVHRVGRTARAGRAGAALAYLAPHEHPYVEFLKLRKVPMTPSAVDEAAPDVRPLLRGEAETDREMMEAGMKAFVSYIRAYKEHQCKYIFRIQDLPIGRLATLFALLRLPHMPEVKRALIRQPGGAKAAGLPACEHFTPSAVDPVTVPFKDKAKEKQRQKALKHKAEGLAGLERREAIEKVAGPAHRAAPVPDAGARLTGAKRRKLQARDELQELAEEYRLLKKVKKGKMSDHEFDLATGLASDEDDDALAPGPRGGAQQGQRSQAAAADSDSDGVDGGSTQRALTHGGLHGVQRQHGASSSVQQHLAAKKKRKKRRQQKGGLGPGAA